MKILIAVVTCHALKARAEAQRQTWVPLVKGADVRFFLGQAERTPADDEVFVDAPDDYNGLPLKVREMAKWAKKQGYDRVLKTDDDSYVYPDRLLDSVPTSDYAGHVNGTDLGWCSGFGYWLSARALDLVARSRKPKDWAEDRWVGSIMARNGIVAENLPGFVVANCIPRYNCLGADVIVACEFDEKEMFIAHHLPGGWQNWKARADASRARKNIQIMRGDGKPFL